MSDFSDDASTPTRGEITGRTQLVQDAEIAASRAESALARAEVRVKRLQLFGGVAFAILGGLVALVWQASKWDQGLARAAQVQAIETRTVALEAWKTDESEQMAWMRSQLVEIARAVRAPVVSVPELQAPMVSPPKGAGHGR